MRADSRGPGVCPPAASCRPVPAATGETEGSLFGKTSFVKAVCPVAAGGSGCNFVGERPPAETGGAAGRGSPEESGRPAEGRGCWPKIGSLDWPRAGDRVVIRSGLAGVDGPAQRLIHWMLDPNTGRPWGVSEAVAITLDLDARKIVPISAAAQAAMRGMITPGLAL